MIIVYTPVLSTTWSYWLQDAWYWYPKSLDFQATPIQESPSQATECQATDFKATEFQETDFQETDFQSMEFQATQLQATYFKATDFQAKLLLAVVDDNRHFYFLSREPVRTLFFLQINSRQLYLARFVLWNHWRILFNPPDNYKTVLREGSQKSQNF